jgi:hypothetical protein
LAHSSITFFIFRAILHLRTSRSVRVTVSDCKKKGQARLCVGEWHGERHIRARWEVSAVRDKASRRASLNERCVARRFPCGRVVDSRGKRVGLVRDQAIVPVRDGKRVPHITIPSRVQPHPHITVGRAKPPSAQNHRAITKPKQTRPCAPDPGIHDGRRPRESTIGRDRARVRYICSRRENVREPSSCE